MFCMLGLIPRVFYCSIYKKRDNSRNTTLMAFRTVDWDSESSKRKVMRLKDFVEMRKSEIRVSTTSSRGGGGRREEVVPQRLRGDEEKLERKLDRK